MSLELLLPVRFCWTEGQLRERHLEQTTDKDCIIKGTLAIVFRLKFVDHGYDGGEKDNSLHGIPGRLLHLFIWWVV